MLHGLKRAYNDALAGEQEVLAHIADIIIEIYVLERAILRTEELISARGERDAATPIDITRTYCSDAAHRTEHSARQVVAALAKTESARGVITCKQKQMLDAGC